MEGRTLCETGNWWKWRSGDRRLIVSSGSARTLPPVTDAAVRSKIRLIQVRFLSLVGIQFGFRVRCLNLQSRCSIRFSVMRFVCASCYGRHCCCNLIFDKPQCYSSVSSHAEKIGSVQIVAMHETNSRFNCSMEELWYWFEDALCMLRVNSRGFTESYRALGLIRFFDNWDSWEV